MRDTVREVRRSYVKDLQKARINKPNERFDIQRLRAVAVTLVVANHLWGWPVAGFVGVDIFFVISGFLITGLLLRSQSSGLGVALRTFYVKRMKRIFPAACVVLALTAVVAGTVFLPSRSASTRQDAVSAPSSSYLIGGSRSLAETILRRRALYLQSVTSGRCPSKSSII